MTRQDTAKIEPARRNHVKAKPQPKPKQETKLTREHKYSPVNFPLYHLAPFNKRKSYHFEPLKTDCKDVVDDNITALDPELLTQPFLELLQMLDRLVKQEPTGMFFDDDKNTLTQTIQLLSKCPDLPDLASIPSFRRHREIHTPEYAEASLMDRPLSVLVPLFVYYTQAKGIESIDEITSTALRELFVRRIMTIRLSPKLKKFILCRGKLYFHEDKWETFPNDEYYRNGTYKWNGKKYYHLYVYNDFSDYEDVE